MPGHHHRSGGLRQSNKKNKRSKASKRSVSRAAGGRVNAKAGIAAAVQQSKVDRRNAAQQMRNNKRQELLRKRRGLDGAAPPPRVVGIISVGASHEIEESLRDFIAKGADTVVRPHEDASVTCKFDVHKKDGALTLLTCRSAFAHYGENDDAAVFAALDLARVCDLLLIVIDGNGPKADDIITEIDIGGDDDDRTTATGKSKYGLDFDHLVSQRGDRILNALKMQGLPTPLTVLAHTKKEAFGNDLVTMQSVKSLRRSSIKRHLEIKNYVSRFATTEFGTGQDKVLEVDMSSLLDADDDMDDIDEQPDLVAESAVSMVARTICNMSCSPSKWVSQVPRSFVLADTSEYVENQRELKLRGYVRGIAPLNINSLVHVPTMGTFAAKSARRLTNPLKLARNKSALGEPTDILEADPEQQEPLDMFASPDSLDGEQNLIGFDDDLEEEQQKDDAESQFARPAGWSDYQSAWLDAVDEDAFDDGVDHGELAKELNMKSDARSVMTSGMDLDEANDISNEERKALEEQRRKEQSEDLEFPDEVQVNEDETAQARFARYRSLKSFRKSHWDPKENLPESYASIYHFSSFKATQRSIMKEMKETVKAAEQARGDFFGSSPQEEGQDAVMDDEDDYDPLDGCIPVGSYIELTLANVAPEAVANTNLDAVLVGVALLPHENKVSVLHGALSQPLHKTTDEKVIAPIKSKDVLTFRCGWRTWKAKPVWSQNNLNCDKHKMERFLPPPGSFFAGSWFGPITYTPCPILVFRETDEGTSELVASGTLLGADADRLIVKRIILTGYPVRVHKRHATVKYMFYNPDDVNWFKPAGLYTKHGLQGNIEQSVGEHGTMKCLFNAPIKQHDTVCLPLYKRIFPKLVEGTNQLTVR